VLLAELLEEALHRRVRCDVVRVEAWIRSIRGFLNANADRNDGRPNILHQVGKSGRLLRRLRGHLRVRGLSPLQVVIAASGNEAGNGNQGYAGEQGDAPFGYTSRLARFIRIIVSHDKVSIAKSVADSVSVLA
jgi:hypothetical protein